MVRKLEIVCFAMCAPWLGGAAFGQVWESWVAWIDGPAYGHPIVVHHAGNVLVSGTVTDDCVTIKYNANGNLLWEARYDGPGSYVDRVFGFVVDAEGNSFVTGQSYGLGTLSDFVTIKYSANGNRLWVSRYDGPASYHDVAYALAVDGDGNVYVTGGSSAAAANDTGDITTIKYDASGNELWVRRFDGPVHGSDAGLAIALGPTGDVYVAGRSEGAGTSSDYITIRYDTNGNQRWVERYDGFGLPDFAHALALDHMGNAYVTGFSRRNFEIWDCATIKYGANGTQLWVQRYQAAYALSGQDIAVHADGSVYVVASGPSAATIKYDSLGNEIWSQPVGLDALALDAVGNVYVPTAWDDAARTIKFAPNGNELWRIDYVAPGETNYTLLSSIDLDAAGNVYVTGTSGSGVERDFVTIKYSQIPPCPGDLDGDAVVGLGDLTLLLSHFGTACDPAPCGYTDGDFDSDGDVDLSDLTLLLSNYGTTCP